MRLFRRLPAFAAGRAQLADGAARPARAQARAVPPAPDEEGGQPGRLLAAGCRQVPQAEADGVDVIAEQVVAVAVGIAPLLPGGMREAAVDLDAQPVRR